MSATFTLAEAMCAARVQIISMFNRTLRGERELLEANGVEADLIDAAMDKARERFDAWLPGELDKIRRFVIDAFTH